MTLHGAVIGAMSLGMLRESPPAVEPAPVYFEVVAEALEEGAEASGPSEVEADNPDVTQVDDRPEAPAVAADEPEAVLPTEDAAAEEAPEPDFVDKLQALPSGGDEGSEAEAAEERAAVISEPVALNRIVPVYPRAARRKGHEGMVSVEIDVAPDGGIDAAEIVASSGYRELDEAALSAVRTARFAPAQADGVRVRGRLRLTFEFHLK